MRHPGHAQAAAAGIAACVVPAHAGGTGGEFHRIAQRKLGGATGLEQHTTALGGVADHQRKGGFAHTGAQLTGAQGGAGAAGEHLQLARAGVALEGEVASNRQSAANVRLQAADTDHWIGQRGHGRQGVAVGTHLQAALGLSSAGGVEAQLCGVGTDVGKAAAAQVQSAAGLQHIRVVGVEHQTKAAVVDACAHPARAQPRADAAARDLQPAGRGRKAHGATECDQVADAERGAARDRSALSRVGAVEGVTGAANSERARAL